jgi:hypothetical protein
VVLLEGRDARLKMGRRATHVLGQHPRCKPAGERDVTPSGTEIMYIRSMPRERLIIIMVIISRLKVMLSQRFSSRDEMLD